MQAVLLQVLSVIVLHEGFFRDVIEKRRQLCFADGLGKIMRLCMYVCMYVCKYVFRGGPTWSWDTSYMSNRKCILSSMVPLYVCMYVCHV
jgi:hypothetical protein